MDKDIAQATAIQQRTVLNAFSRALGRENHILSQQPYLLWQQLYNRLQWEGEGVLQTIATEFTHRSETKSTPWARMRTPYRESQELLRTMTDSSGNIIAFAVSPDGSRIMSANERNELTIWDAVYGEELRKLKHHDRIIKACNVIPDNIWIISANKDNTLKIWDAERDQVLQTLHALKIKGKSESITCCTVSSCGRWIATASMLSLENLEASNIAKMLLRMPDSGFEFVLRIWDMVSANEWLTFNGHTGAIKACAFSPDGTRIVSASKDKTLKIWDIASDTELHTLKGHTGAVNACSFSPDGAWIASASGGTIKIWDAAKGQELPTLSIFHGGEVNACVFSPEGTRIVSASDDRTLKIWDMDNGQELCTLLGHTGKVRACEFTPDGTRIISVSDDGMLKIWGTAKRQEPGRSLRSALSASMERLAFSGIETGHTDSLLSCAINSDGTRIVSSSKDKTLKVWGLATGQTLLTLKGHTGTVNACSFNPDGCWIISASEDRTIKIWDASNGQELRTLKGHTDKVNACTFSPDGSWIVSASNDTVLKIWNAAKGREERTFNGHTYWVTGCAVSPDGVWIVSASRDKTLRIWNTLSGDRARRILKGHTDSINACILSPDGSWVVSASDDKLIKIWNKADGQEFRTITGHRDKVMSCAFSPDGAYIISVSLDDTFKLWRLVDGMEVFTIPLGSLRCVALHPWKPVAVSGDTGGSLYILDLVGIDYGPIILTAIRKKLGQSVRCPACQQEHPIKQEQLGSELTCPTPGCGLRLKINPFVIDTTVNISESMDKQA